MPSPAALSSNETTWLADGKPLLGHNAALEARVAGNVTAKWVTGGTWAGSDVTDSAYPASRALDDLTQLPTRPTSTYTTIYLLFDFGSAGIDFDAVGIIGHNAASGSSVQYDLQHADDNAYSTNLVTLATFNPSDNGRLVDLTIDGAAQRYSGVRYARLKITAGGAYKPEISEVLFIRRRQLEFAPFRPYDSGELVQSSSAWRSESGARVAYTRNSGQRALNAPFFVRSTELTGLKAWRRSIREGADGFVWIEDPSSSPEASMYWMHTSEAETIPMRNAGPNHALVDLRALEQGPNYLSGEG